MVDDDFVFDTVTKPGKRPKLHATTVDTGGCSCEQIIEKFGLGEGKRKYGCSKGIMKKWISIVESENSGDD